MAPKAIIAPLGGEADIDACLDIPPGLLQAFKPARPDTCDQPRAIKLPSSCPCALSICQLTARLRSLELQGCGSCLTCLPATSPFVAAHGSHLELTSSVSRDAPGLRLAPSHCKSLLSSVVHPPCPSPVVHPPCPSPVVHPPCPSPVVHPPCPSPVVHPLCPSPVVHPPCPSPVVHPPAQAPWFSPLPPSSPVVYPPAKPRRSSS
jgi:hypothetical protein